MRILLVFQEQVSSFSPVQMHLKTCMRSWFSSLLSRQRVGSVHYKFKLPVQHYSEFLSGKEYDEYAHNKI